jgi:type II secretory pathway component PulJ
MAINRQQRGITLVEVLIASSLAVTLAFFATSLFVAVNNLFDTSTTSHMLSRDLNVGIESLRNDLKETVLGCVRVTAKDEPGLTIVTPYSVDGKLALDSQGAPRWQGWVHYALEDNGSKETATLVKWAEPYSMAIPEVSIHAPSPIPQGVQQRVVLRDVVRPGATLPDISGEPMEISEDDGFSVRFLRLEDGKYVSTTSNPASFSAPGRDPSGNTRLLEVHIRTYQKMVSTQSSTIGIRFRVTPRFGY